MKKLKWIGLGLIVLICAAGIIGKIAGGADDKPKDPKAEISESNKTGATKGYLDKDGVVVLPDGEKESSSESHEATPDPPTEPSTIDVVKEGQTNTKPAPVTEPTEFDVLVTTAKIPFNVTGRKGILELLLPQTLTAPHVRVRQESVGDGSITGIYIYAGKENNSADNMFLGMQLMNKEQVIKNTAPELIQEIPDTGMYLVRLPLMPDAMTEAAFANYEESYKYLKQIMSNATVNFE